MNNDIDVDQETHVEALIELAWPHIEDELIHRSCFKSQLEARSVAPDPSSPPVTTQKSFSSPPLLQSVGVHNDLGLLASSAVASHTASRQQLHTKVVFNSQKSEPDDTKKGLPCSSPCRSSMPLNSMVSHQKRESIVSPPKPKKRPSINSGRDAILTVHYREGEQPMADFLRLEGGQGTPVIVEAVAMGSKAACAGVQPGYALVTMNGRSEFTQLPGWQVRLLLEAPITLGFDPSFQALRPQLGTCTEIRLKRAAESIGVPPVVGVCGPTDYGMLAEEVVFKPASAPIFLKSGTSFSESSMANGSGIHLNVVEDCTSTTGGNKPIVYELRHKDAQTIVGRAVHCARQAVDSTFEAECVMDPAWDNYQCSYRSLSPVSFCNMDCVAGYDNDDSNTGLGDRIAQPKQYRLYRRRRFSESGLRGVDIDERRVTHAAEILATANTPSRKQVPNLKHDLAKATATIHPPELQSEDCDGNIDLGSQYPVSPRSSMHGGSRCGCGREEEDDSWLNFHSSRSPLRFLAPVLDPVMRVLSPSRSPPKPPRAEPQFSPRTPPPSARASTRSSGGTNVFGGVPSTSAVGRSFKPLHGGAATSPRVVPSPSPFLGPPHGHSGISKLVSAIRGGDDIFSHMTRESPRRSHSPRGMRQLSTQGSPRTTGVAPCVGNVHVLTNKRKSLSPQNRKPVGDRSAEVIDLESLRPSLSPAVPHTASTPTMLPQPSFDNSWSGDLQGRSHGRVASGSKSPRVRSKSPTFVPYMMTPLQQLVLSRERQS